jgi:membrane associated rhomboid family serine protease
VLIPYSTDAPIYHYPIATTSFIVINVICFLAFGLGVADPGLEIDANPLQKLKLLQDLGGMPLEAGEADPIDELDLVDVSTFSWREELALQFGRGLRPWQWVTSLFLHSDPRHLIVNMIFLWSFGLVIEGKLGWLLFSLMYLGLGAFQGFAEQTLLLFASGETLGASGAIFSLLGLVVVFAPLNSFETFVFFGFRLFFFEAPILVFCGIYLFMNLLLLFLIGDGLGIETIQLIGFLVGLPMGFFLLLQGYVDCEGYDIISHLTEKKGTESKVGVKKVREREAKREAKMIASIPKVDQQKVRAKMASQVDQAIEEGNFDLAVALQSKIAANNPGSGWTQPQLIRVIQHYLQEKQLSKAEPLLVLHSEIFDEHRFQLQVKLLRLWLHEQRPRHALRYMQGLNPAFLSDDNRFELKKLDEYAQKQIQAGVLETQ